MTDIVVNSNFALLSKFVASRQESTLKTATSHIKTTLFYINMKSKFN